MQEGVLSHSRRGISEWIDDDCDDDCWCFNVHEPFRSLSAISAQPPFFFVQSMINGGKNDRVRLTVGAGLNLGRQITVPTPHRLS